VSEDGLGMVMSYCANHWNRMIFKNIIKNSLVLWSQTQWSDYKNDLSVRFFKCLCMLRIIYK